MSNPPINRIQPKPNPNQPRQATGELGGAWSPPPLNSLNDTGLNLLAVAELVLKVLYFGGYMSGHTISDIVKLPFTGVLDSVIDFLKREKFIEVKGSGGLGEASFQYLISNAGAAKAREALERSQYAGPAPVTLQQYIASLRSQNKERLIVHEEQMKTVTNHLVISDDMLARIGPAINSGRSMFLYGPPGNGKTTVAEQVGRLVLGDTIWIPYAFDVDGQIVRVFDNVNHELADDMSTKLGTGVVMDPRWVRIRRPMIMVGGELTLSGLDLVYDSINKYYEAPFQVKANGGMFLIDDFGRQQVRPRDLLNRWIVPLEKGVDFLTLATGRKIEIPFFVLIVFSTNIDPRDLVDEAFLRRIRHKIEITDPTYEQFRDIFKRVCTAKGVKYDEQALAYLLKEWYISKNRALRAVHPRDLINQLLDIATYLNKPPVLSKDMIDRSAASYFVNLD
ncbi:MAG: ATP-binding protein [Chloroflexi bacterium]|uniref:ATP-binding protein n=1 Tax=Candidatus Flexifilum breve TaxID=3140694 RepID=UPI00313521D6|nr:ATP-binding protein [Chloroflexota bacterium]MBK9750423.1 ATP-binding protein [Chloroflexota bacterium]